MGPKGVPFSGKPKESGAAVPCSILRNPMGHGTCLQLPETCVKRLMTIAILRNATAP